MAEFPDLVTEYALTQEHIAQYREHAFIKLNRVLGPETIQYFGKTITEMVVELNTMHVPMEERSTYEKAFLQVMNIWQQDDRVRRLVFSRRLARIAAQLLGVAGVRLYHDQALYKEPGGGHTPWHADQYYWPLASDRTVTAWIPLQSTPLEMGPLEFSGGSHRLPGGRGVAISDESESFIQDLLDRSDTTHVIKPFDLGDVSFHAGWLYHRAGPNTSDRVRRVMTIIYMDAEMRLKKPKNDNQQADWEAWCPGARIGEIIDTPLNPILYHKEHDATNA
jgi:ectoine hydroxylase-related dioxygenase (phytanoyl-CoA dioxygenase family)